MTTALYLSRKVSYKVTGAWSLCGRNMHCEEDYLKENVRSSFFGSGFITAT